MDVPETPDPELKKALSEIPGGGPMASFDRWWLLLLGVLALILLLIISSPDPYLRIVMFVRDGIVVTIATTIISFILILIVGLMVALMRLSGNRFVVTVATVYVEVVRGIPLLVQLFSGILLFHRSSRKLVPGSILRFSRTI